ncbi:MAG: ABC transporter ATP-binding protein, partial [Spirochaetes bacterium]
NPKIMILDDSLSAVDSETDSSIRASLKRRYGNATVIIIAHRTSTLSEADRILVLEQGRITQEGSHSELIGQNGLYKRIWDIQNAGSQEAVS